MRVRLKKFATYREALAAARKVAESSGFAIDVRRLDTGAWEIEGPGSIVATDKSWDGEHASLHAFEGPDFDELDTAKARIEELNRHQADHQRNEASGWPYED